MVVAIKVVHTLAWASIESCVLYALFAGMAGRTDKRVGIAGAVVAGESLVFAVNGFRCPLTELAERYGAERGSVTDIYLPTWFAHRIPAIHAPLLVLMTYLHARNLRRSRHARRRRDLRTLRWPRDRVSGTASKADWAVSLASEVAHHRGIDAVTSRGAPEGHEPSDSVAISSANARGPRRGGRAAGDRG